ncbi:MAG: glycosyltransferase family 2 protein [Bacteroidota bacterium]
MIPADNTIHTNPAQGSFSADAQAPFIQQRAEVDYTVLVPVYFNEGSLEKTYELIMTQVVAANPTRSYEFVFIDDGSGDGSYAELLGIKAKNPDNVTVIKLSRNFGQVSAFMAGYSLARGKCIINISADLQDPPHLINEMLDNHFNHGFQIVICTREAREESYFRRKTSKLFYAWMKKLSFKNMPEGGFDFALISARVKNIILSQREANPFWQGQILWTGFAIKWIPYTRLAREIGTSRWTFAKKVKYLLDGVLSYSYYPLRLMSGIGLITALIGFLYALVVIAQYFMGGAPFQGWSPIMIVLLVVSGLQMLMLGIIGEYLWRTLDQTRNRGQFIIESVK